MTQLAFTAHAAAAPLLLGAGRAVIDPYLLPAEPTAANPPHAVAVASTWDRRADRHRTVTYTLLHATRAVSLKTLHSLLLHMTVSQQVHQHTAIDNSLVNISTGTSK